MSLAIRKQAQGTQLLTIALRIIKDIFIPAEETNDSQAKGHAVPLLAAVGFSHRENIFISFSKALV